MAPRKDEQRTPVIFDADGNPVRLDDLPLVAFRLTCGHLHKDLGYLRGDLYFCDTCGTQKRITKILAK